jgi:hypothetical protein
MFCRRIAGHAAVVMTLAACSSPDVTQPIPKITARDVSRHDYIDSASYYNGGYPPPSIVNGGISGGFNPTHTAFQATLQYEYAAVSDLDVSLLGRILDKNGTELNRDPEARSWGHILPISGHDSVSTAPYTNGRKCGINGYAEATAAATMRILMNLSFTEIWHDGFTTSATATLPDCPAPKANIALSYGAATGSELHLTLPAGLSANVSGSASGSTIADGASPITTYAWTVGSANAGSSASFSSTFYSTQGVWLTVTDQDGATASASGQVAIDFIQPCDDPETEETETTCDWRSPGDEITSGNQSEEDGLPHGGSPTSIWVCYLTDWYQWNGYGWDYTGYTVDYCDLE